MGIGWNPETEAELQTAIDELVCRAYENEVLSEDTVYSLRHDDPEKPDWDITIVRLSKPTADDISAIDSLEIDDQRASGSSPP